MQAGAQRGVDLRLGAQAVGQLAGHHLGAVLRLGLNARKGEHRRLGGVSCAPLPSHVRAVARVAQPRGGDRARVDRAERERLLELRRPGQDLAVLVDREAVAVEDELVLAAHGVHEDDGGEVVHRALDEHPLAPGAHAAPIGDADRFTITWAPASASVIAGRAGLPDVLADAEPDRDAVQLDDRRLGARLEVALLVEDAVVRQVHLAVGGHHVAVGEHRGGVVDVLGLLRIAHHGGDALRLAGELLQRGSAASRKLVFSSRSSGG